MTGLIAQDYLPNGVGPLLENNQTSEQDRGDRSCSDCSAQSLFSNSADGNMYGGTSDSQSPWSTYDDFSVTSSFYSVVFWGI